MDVSKKPSCPIATSKERGLPAPSPVQSSPEEIVAPEISMEVSPFPLVVSGVKVIDSEEGSEEEETSDEESSESQGNAASSFRDSSKTCLFVPESDCVIDAHFGIGLDFVDVGKLDDSAPCSESVLVVGSDSKGSSGSQTGGKLEEHKASVQPREDGDWDSRVFRRVVFPASSLWRVFCRPYLEWDPAGSGGPMVCAFCSFVFRDHLMFLPINVGPILCGIIWWWSVGNLRAYGLSGFWAGGQMDFVWDYLVVGFGREDRWIFIFPSFAGSGFDSSLVAPYFFEWAVLAVLGLECGF
ncbi:hypothetical protein U1Q18_040377 [Sarracenia purpurea var. burkii]